MSRILKFVENVEGVNVRDVGFADLDPARPSDRTSDELATSDELPPSRFLHHPQLRIRLGRRMTQIE